MWCQWLITALDLIFWCLAASRLQTPAQHHTVWGQDLTFYSSVQPNRGRKNIQATQRVFFSKKKAKTLKSWVWRTSTTRILTLCLTCCCVLPWSLQAEAKKDKHKKTKRNVIDTVYLPQVRHLLLSRLDSGNKDQRRHSWELAQDWWVHVSSYCQRVVVLFWCFTHWYSECDIWPNLKDLFRDLYYKCKAIYSLAKCCAGSLHVGFKYRSIIIYYLK